MKKFVFALSAIFFSCALFSQTLYLEGKGAYSSTWLFNKNISDDGDEQDYNAGWGYSYGLGGSMFFNKKLGVGVDLLLGKHTGAYKGDMDSLGTYESWASLNHFSIPILFKVKNETGSYIEIGPQYSSISKAEFRYKHALPTPGGTVVSDTTSDAGSYYSKSNISMVLGIGIGIKFTDRIGLKTGFRFEYGLADLKGLDGMGRDLNNPFNYKVFEPTNSATGSFMLGVYFMLGSEDDSGGSPPNRPE